MPVCYNMHRVTGNMAPPSMATIQGPPLLVELCHKMFLDGRITPALFDGMLLQPLFRVPDCPSAHYTRVTIAPHVAFGARVAIDSLTACLENKAGSFAANTLFEVAPQYHSSSRDQLAEFMKRDVPALSGPPALPSFPNLSGCAIEHFRYRPRP